MFMHVSSIVFIGVFCNCLFEFAQAKDKVSKCKDCKYIGHCKPKKLSDENECVNFKCFKYQQNDKDTIKVLNLTEEIPNKYGCPFNGGCMKFGEKRVDNDTCIKHSCYKTYERSPILNKFYLGHIMISSPIGCKQGKRCMPINSTWSDPKKCVQYTCSRYNEKKSSTFGARYVKNSNACIFQGTCMKFGETIQDKSSCKKYTCQKTYEKTSDQISFIGDNIKSENYGCRIDGICRQQGEEWMEEACITKKCISDYPELYKELGIRPPCMSEMGCEVSGPDRNIYIVDRGCNDNGKCRKEYEEWTEGECNRKKCIFNGSESRIVYTLKGEKDDNGKCHITWRPNDLIG